MGAIPNQLPGRIILQFSLDWCVRFSSQLLQSDSIVGYITTDYMLWLPSQTMLTSAITVQYTSPDYQSLQVCSTNMPIIHCTWWIISCVVSHWFFRTRTICTTSKITAICGLPCITSRWCKLSNQKILHLRHSQKGNTDIAYCVDLLQDESTPILYDPGQVFLTRLIVVTEIQTERRRVRYRTERSQKVTRLPNNNRNHLHLK